MNFKTFERAFYFKITLTDFFTGEDKRTKSRPSGGCVNIKKEDHDESTKEDANSDSHAFDQDGKNEATVAPSGDSYEIKTDQDQLNNEKE